MRRLDINTDDEDVTTIKDLLPEDPGESKSPDDESEEPAESDESDSDDPEDGPDVMRTSN